MPEVAIQSFKTVLTNAAGRRPGQASVVEIAPRMTQPLSQAGIVDTVDVELGQRDDIRFRGHRDVSVVSPGTIRTRADIFIALEDKREDDLYIGIRHPAFPICLGEYITGFWIHDVKAEGGYISFAKILNNNGAVVSHGIFESSSTFFCLSFESEREFLPDYWVAKFLTLLVNIEGRRRVIRAQLNDLNDYALTLGSRVGGELLGEVDFSDPHYLIWGVKNFDARTRDNLTINLGYGEGEFLPVRVDRYRQQYSRLAKGEAMRALSELKGEGVDSQNDGVRRLLDAISFTGLRSI